ncbi:NAD(P)/FAD-dependent oxidoreductase [Agrobacterium sp. El2ro-1b]|uniref:NAD(P)/FAD-dependent oxidoreductase n=1 Tax=Agrobacterium sp. El2ro-1b TaxID=2969528 RepID=UPI003AAC44B2
MKNRQADVLIVGGGLVGSAAAFFLRQRGRSVILLERFLVGQQASGTNFGNVRRQGRYLRQLPLANRSREIWENIPKLTGSDVEFLQVGHIRFAWRDEQIAAIEDYARNASEFGLDLEIIGKAALRARFPFSGDEAVAGSFSPLDGHANPRLAAPAFARAARRDGATVIENCEVLSLEKVGDDFVAQTAQGEFRAPSVLVASGAWGGRLSEAFGETVPITPGGPQMGVTEPAPYFIKPVVGVSTKRPEEVMYLRQIPRGNVIFGGVKRRPAALDEQRAKYSPACLLPQFAQLTRLVPALKHLKIIRTWSGVEGYMSDDLPIMGRSGRVSGLYYAFGFCGHGFQLGPGVGDVMAELIDTGSTRTPIEDFCIQRFAAKGS